MKRFEGLLPVFQMANDEHETEFQDTAPNFYRFNAWFEDVSEMFAKILSALHPDNKVEPAKDTVAQAPEHDDDIVEVQSGEDQSPPEIAETETVDPVGLHTDAMLELPVEFPIFEAEISPPDLPIASVAEPVQISNDVALEPTGPASEPTPVTGVETQITPVVSPPVQPPEITPTTGDEFLGIPIIYLEDLPPAEIEDDDAEPAFLDCMF